MFSGNEGNNGNRRKSFFLFGGSPYATPETATKPSNTKAHKMSTRKHSSSKGPLEKQPLNNKNPFIKEDVPNVAESAGNLTPNPENIQGQSALKNHSSSEKEKDTTLRRLNTNPFTSDLTYDISSSKAPRSRRPPPPIDIDKIDLLREVSPLESSQTEKVSQPNSAEETLKSVLNSPVKTPVPSSETIGANQHRRQRSEAEKLVDDLEVYIKQHEEPGSSQDFYGKEDHFQPGSYLDSRENFDIDEESVIESPFTYTGPLDVVQHHMNAPVTNVLSKRKSDVPSDFDGDYDRFSFTTSLNDKSVKSIQQVAINDATGAAPILTDLNCKLSVDVSGSIREDSRDNSSSNMSSVDDHLVNNGGAFAAEKQELSPRKSHETRILDHVSDIEINTSSDGSRLYPKPHRRTFRVVNEDRPSFYLTAEGNRTTSTATSRTASTNSTTEEEGEELQTNYSVPTHSSPYDKHIASPVSISENYNDQSSHNGSIINKIIPKVQDVAITENRTSLVESDTLKGNIEMKGPTPIIDNITLPSSGSTKSNGSLTTASSTSPKPDQTVNLVSSYVEELRLKYYKTSNFLQAPPNLPITLKQKNNLIQPKNIKVRIRTSSKQIGIKHGRAKQKLLTLETTEEDTNDNAKFLGHKNKINVDHTKEFHNLLSKGGITTHLNGSNDQKLEDEDNEDPDYYLKEIPGDEAYDSDDAMAPLREKSVVREAKAISRSNTVVSYYTKNQRRLRSGTLENSYAHLQKLPTDIRIADYRDKESEKRIARTDSIEREGSDELESAHYYGQGLHVANPDSESD